ncbi:MAG: immune inhibitor A, partial [Chloroflexi bacterium]|nr:immune inhibitor A [Chloroflexota bacterium]
ILAPCEGICGVQSALNKRANGLLFDDAFADWAATNFLNNPAIENGRYAYSNEKDFKISRETTIARYPMQLAVTMHEYGANYYALDPQARDVTIYFTGTTTAKLLPINAHSGKWMWYSNRADLADMNLTREVDLARVTKATLKFWTWYSIEKDFDYAYVQVSTDGGKTWDILPGKNTTTDDPNGSSFGPAFTGKSGTKDDRGEAQWIQEQMDLSPYAGKKILLRFEYLTDDAFNQPGFVVDDIEIPEINFSDDAEKILAGWTANGFVRVDNVLPQKYIVQIIQIGNSTRVTRLALDAQNRGKFSMTGLNNFSKVEVVVTAHAPTTTEATEYQIEVR